MLGGEPVFRDEHPDTGGFREAARQLAVEGAASRREASAVQVQHGLAGQGGSGLAAAYPFAANMPEHGLMELQAGQRGAPNGFLLQRLPDLDMIMASLPGVLS
ncbi:hypothetical protein D3C73_1399290 [compost metagenome]